jgi:hypothetical protein
MSTKVTIKKRDTVEGAYSDIYPKTTVDQVEGLDTLINNPPVVDITGTTTLSTAHINKFIRYTSSSAGTLTLDTVANAGFKIGDEIHISRFGTGEVTLAPASSKTLVSESTKRRINARYQAVTLKMYDTDAWILFGALKT